jgi:hypothetical protein
MMLRGLVPILCVLGATLTGSGSDSDPDSASVLVESPMARTRVLDGSSTLPSTPRSLPFFYDLHTFRTDGGGTTVVAAIAVPVSRLRRERKDGRVRYRFDVRFVLADTAQRTVFHTEDSVFVSAPRALPRQHLLHTYVEIQAAPSTATLQRVVVTDAARPGVGQLYTTPFAIPDYSGSELMLSDIAFGLPGAEGGWTRRGVSLALLPTSQFPESSFDVYYEIYNLPSGNPYDTEISIQPLDDDGSDSEDRAVRALFSGESESGADGSVAELRRVESALPKGSYRFTITVTDRVSGQTTASSRLVQVRGWRIGTTMVRAMPRGVGR